MKVKILAFAGSTRTESWNKKLLMAGVEGARKAGAEVTVIDLRDFPLPLYDGDLEEKEGIPHYGKKLKELFLAHQGFLIASPEYNSSISGVLKNAIDWVSRPVPGEVPNIYFIGKVVALLSTSPGALGGLRGLVHLRAIMGNIGSIVIPEQIFVPKAMEAFDSHGNLKDDRVRQSIEKVAARLVDVTRKLNQTNPEIA